MNHAARSALITFPLAALFNSFSMTALILVLGIAGWHEVAADIGLVQGATLALFYAFSANARNLILVDASGCTATRLLQTRLLLLLPLAGVSYYLSVGIGTVSGSLAVVLIVRRMSEWIGEIGLAKHERMNQTEFARHALVAECVTLILALLLLWFGLDLTFSAIPWAFAPLLATRRAKLSWRGAEGHINFPMLLPHFGSTAIIGTSVYIFRLSIILLIGKTIAGELFTAFAIGGIIPTIVGQAFAPTLIHRFGASGLSRSLLVIPASMLLVAAGVIALAITPPPLVACSRPLTDILAGRRLFHFWWCDYERGGGVARSVGSRGRWKPGLWPRFTGQCAGCRQCALLLPSVRSRITGGPVRSEQLSQPDLFVGGKAPEEIGQTTFYVCSSRHRRVVNIPGFFSD